MAGDIFDEIAKANTSRRGNNFNGGRGVAAVKQLIYKDLLDGPTFIAELEVVEIAANGVCAKDQALSQVGGTFSYIQKVKKFPKNAPGNVKAFMCALWGVDEEDPNFGTPSKDHPVFGLKADGSAFTFRERFEEFTAPGQPGRGVLLRFDSYAQQTENQQRTGRGEFNVYPTFTPVAAQSDEDIAKRRGALGG